MSKEKSSDLKRNEIITCPYFRMSSWQNQKNQKIYDFYCKLDYMIFYTYRADSNKITDRDKKTMQMNMRQNCALECPKMWKCGYEDDFDIFDDDFFESKQDDYPESLNEERDYLLYGWKKEIEGDKNLPAKIEKDIPF